MASSRDLEEGGGVRDDEQREDEEISRSRRGHMSLRSGNPRHSNNGVSARQAENLRMESANLVVADEFGGYFVNSETRILAILTAAFSVTAAVIVAYPNCETGGFLTEVSVALTILVSLIIPGFGIYGSWKKQEVQLQVFRFLSFIFGSYAAVNLLRVLAEPQVITNSLNACDVGEPCLETYFLLEGLYSITYTVLNVSVSSLLITKIREVEARSAVASVEARQAHVLRNATLVAVFDPNIREENLVHPAARTVPLVRPGTLYKGRSRTLGSVSKPLRNGKKPKVWFRH